MGNTTWPWECPKCGAKAHQHGKGGKSACVNFRHDGCEGLICECYDDDGNGGSDLPTHGTTLENPCRNANCYHCGWGGTLPVKPKGLQSWEKKALEAGWIMPEARKKELKGDTHG